MSSELTRTGDWGDLARPRTLEAMVEDGEGRLYLVFEPGGSLLSCSASARALVAEGAALAGLAERVARVFDDGAEWQGEVAGLGRVELRRLDGALDARVLAVIEPRNAALDALSPAQREVAELAASGASIPEIARLLGRSAETARTHLREAYRRLGVGSRLELAEALEGRRSTAPRPEGKRGRRSDG